MSKLSVDLSEMREPLKIQLKKQGIIFSDLFMKNIEADITAICRLRIRGMITRSEANKAEKRITKKIVSSLKYSINP